jgi:hypothetical protein
MRRISLRVFIILFLILECVSLIFDPATLYSQTAKSNSHQDAVLDLRLGFAEDGTVTPEWIEVIRYLRNEQNISAPQFSRRTLTEEEALWADLIERKVLIWPDMVDSLRIPFGSITPPDTVTILLGNQGGEDAFVYSDSTICFDLNKLNLQKWVDAGPPGILMLAQKYLREDLKGAMPKITEK